jgi:RNA recognition motif-containing protein
MRLSASSESVSIPKNPRTDRPVGYAFVDLSTPSEAERAIAELSGKEILERKVSVQLARKPEPNDKGEGANAEGGAEGTRRRQSTRGRGRAGRGRGGRARGGRAAATGGVSHPRQRALQELSWSTTHMDTDVVPGGEEGGGRCPRRERRPGCREGPTRGPQGRYERGHQGEQGCQA